MIDPIKFYSPVWRWLNS